MSKSHLPDPKVELLPLPARKGALGEIFEARVLHHMREAAEGMRNRHYIANAVVFVLEVHGHASYGDETGRQVPLKPGSCFLIDPELGHHYGPLEDSYWTELYVSFRGPLFDALIRLMRMMEHPVRRIEDVGLWRRKLLAVLPHAGNATESDACCGRLAAFLTEMFPVLRDPAHQDPGWLALAKDMLEREFSPISEVTARCAERSGLAAETVRKQFRLLTGQSMKSWQIKSRIATARSLMARGNMTQKEIAATLGFASPQHFSRSIRMTTGAAPSRFMKKTTGE